MYVSKKYIHHVYAAKDGDMCAAKIAFYSLGRQYPYFSVTNANGCDHDHILKKFPELKPLIDLHLCDGDGAPMGDAGNAFYFYAEGVTKDLERCFFSSEEEKEQEKARREACGIEALLNLTGMPRLLAEDIWDTIKGWNKYESEYFAKAAELKNAASSISTKLVVARDNEALARHLRISVEEAATIPAGLTEKEFTLNYVDTHRPRWKAEAESALTWLKEKEALYPPFYDEMEYGKTYFFGEANYREMLPAITKQLHTFG